MRRVIIALIMITLLIPAVSQATDVGGIINSNTTWTLANSPYNFTSVVQVAAGVTLTIEPGVELNGADEISHELELWGSLYAVGNDSSMIVFNSCSIIAKDATSSIQLEYVERNLGSITNISGCDMIIRNSLINVGAIVIRSANDIVERNILKDSYLQVQHGSSSIAIRNNLFYTGSGNPFKLLIDVIADPIIELNTFLSTNEIVIENYCCSTSNNVTASNNYWNTTETTIIDSMILDRNDDLNRSYIIYDPILTAPDQDTPTNIPPSADAGTDQNLEEDSIVTLDGTGSDDVDDGIETYLWEQISGISVDLSDTGAVQPTFTAPNVGPAGGVLEFQLTVTDYAGASDISTCLVSISDNDASISGTVIETQGGQPVNGLVVRAHDYTTGTWIISATTQADGSYTIPDLAAGSYRVVVQTTGTDYAQEYYDSTYDYNTATAINLSEGQTFSGIDFSLEIGGKIEGTVTDTDSGLAVEGIRLSACDYTSGSCVSYALTISDGTYSITGIPTGSYRIWAEGNGTDYANEYYLDTYDPSNATPVDVVQPQTITGYDFSLELGGTVSGVVTASGSGQPLEGIRLEAYDYAAGFWVRGTQTSSDGSYSLTGIPAGNYRVYTYDPQRIYAPEYYDNTSDYDYATQVDVIQNQTIPSIDFSLDQAGSISGTVTGSDAQPLVDVWVTAYYDRCWNQAVGSAKTDQNGNYSITGLPAGRIYLFADATYETPRNYINEWWNGGDGTDDCNYAMAFTALAGQNIPNMDFVLDHSFPITFVEKNVQQSDGSFETYVEVVIEEEFDGVLPDDITDIAITGPSGPLPYDITDFTYYPQFRDFVLKIPGSPQIGVYTATVTASDSATATDTNIQHVNNILPIPETVTFSPSDGATLSSKTPSFSWAAVNSAGGPIYYRMWINDAQGDRVFSTAREQDLLACTVPEGLLLPGQTYDWYVRVGDNADWELEDNRSNSAWVTFTMAGSLSPHNAKPAIDPAQWGAVAYSNANGTDLSLSVRVIDHDGVAYDGSSHLVEVTFPDGITVRQLEHIRATSPTSGEYDFWQEGFPQAGDYTFTVTDPDGNTGTYVDTLVVNPLDAPDEDSFTPSLKNPTSESLTATFDNVYVNGQPYENFDTYSSIEDLDYKKWEPWHQNATIQNQKLEVILDNTVGRGNGGLTFANPAGIQSLQADISVPSISMDSSAGGRISGTFLNNGIGDISANIYVRNNRVTYNVSVENINAQETYEWENLDGGQLMSISLGQTVTVSISWDGTKLTLNADGNTAEYTPSGSNFTPPKYPYMSMVARMNLVTDTTPTFTWDPVPGANRYKVRIFSYNNNRTVWNGYAGNTTSYTVPPGVLSPDAYYRYRIEARDAHNPLNVDNNSKSPTSSNDNYRFYTGSTGAVAPYIEFDHAGVQVWNNEVLGTYLTFWIIVHDAQGVPGDIKSVKVVYPSGYEELLYFYPGITSNTPTGGVYIRNSFPASIENGTYTFVAEDLSGNIYSVDEILTANPIGYPDVATLTPSHNALINNTALDFDWEDVSGAAFYRLDIYDKNGNLLYKFPTTQSEYQLPEGFLEEKSLYRYRIKTRREFFDQNVDNGSSSPWEQSESVEFLTTAITGGASSPDIDLNNLGAYVIHTVRPDTSNSSYWLTFEVKVTDTDGVPANIESVQVVYPDGLTTLDLRYDEEISTTEAIYEGYEVYDDSSEIQEGVYTFIITDYDSNMRLGNDTLDVNEVHLPVNLTPAADSVVTTSTPTIEWDDVPGALRYRVRLYDGYDTPLQWSDYLTESTYTFDPGVLELNKTYSYRIYSYREQAPDVDVDNCSIQRIYYSDMPHFTVRADTDGDGVADVEDAFPDDPNEWLDTDGDGIGDNEDTDDDNDGFDDIDDAFPKDPNEWYDTDGDGIGNNADTDDDNDGYVDIYDSNPTVANDPGGPNYNCITDTRLYTISGTISYAGVQRDSIYVAVFDDVGMTTILQETQIASPSGSGPWLYNISDVPARNEYYVEAFMDFNGNVALDNDEPEGILGPFSITSSMTDKNVTLIGDNPVINSMPWIPLLLIGD